MTSRASRTLVEANRPRIVAFNGKRSATVVLDRPVDYGRQPDGLADAAVWVLPSTSAAARGHSDISVWQQLADDARSCPPTLVPRSFATLGVSGCAAGPARHARPRPQATSPPAPVATTAPTRPAKRPPHRPRPRRRRPPAAPGRRSGGLAYSTASNDVVQAQPAPGSCHAIGSGLYSRPDPACTPGALNPAVSQATIDRTICVEGWTDTVRPPESVTEREKAASLAAYGDTGPLSAYEYDHFVPLELGGATNDPRNLWPEPGDSPNPKDAVEDELRQKVCDGRLSLAQAQREIVTNWVSLARARPTAPDEPTTGRHCTRSRRRVHAHRVVQLPLRRLRRVRALQPARSDRDGHRRRRPLRQLAHGWLRLCRRLLQAGRLRARTDHHRARRPGHLLDEPLNEPTSS